VRGASERRAPGLPRAWGIRRGAILLHKQIYEALPSETKAESFEGNQHTGNLAADNLSFANAASEATGKDERTVPRAPPRAGKPLARTLGPSFRCLSLNSLTEAKTQLVSSYA
jgi:hypothetical protein